MYRGSGLEIGNIFANVAASGGSGPGSDSEAGTQSTASLMRQRALVWQVREMQQTIAHLQMEEGGGTEEARLRDQISALQAEVERLQVQMEQMWLRELDDDPPPEYHENENSDIVEVAAR